MRGLLSSPNLQSSDRKMKDVRPISEECCENTQKGYHLRVGNGFLGGSKDKMDKAKKSQKTSSGRGCKRLVARETARHESN